MKVRSCEGVKLSKSLFPASVPSHLHTLSPSHLRSSGFTLIELLIVITIIGMMFSVSVPISYSIYQRYQASLKAEKVLTLVSSMRLDAFLHGRDQLIESKEGRMLVNGIDSGGFEDLFIQIDSPIIFYRSGTTSGGEIKVYADKNTFLIEIQSPLGELTLKSA
ncbi:MAG: prepilin-type N-terminal cleavage/methylation domain-containing protein [Dissulfurispiraceae bacterium]|jgi:prepilin-type N-terminal cleavage/methylation domain-containing protein